MRDTNRTQAYMLRNYLIIAIRNILNQKFFSILNILGLAAGIATFLFIYVYVKSEEFYDKDWDNATSIYRVSQHISFGEEKDFFAMSSYPLANALNKKFPEVKHAIRVSQYFQRPIKVDTSYYQADRLVYADKNFFDVFNFEFTEGVAKQSLNRDNSVVISNELAQKIFPKQSAVGKVIEFSGASFMIRGVFNTYRKKSHIRPQIIVSFEHIYKNKKKEWDDSWMRLWVYTYMELKSPNMYDSFMEDFNNWQDTTMHIWLNKVKLNNKITFLPQPVRGLHFDRNHIYTLSRSADPYYFNILSLVAFLVLMIASVNFVNLGTARSVKRAREVGVRKVCGATRLQLIIQFISESIIIASLACLIALMLIEFSLPFLNNYLGTDLSLFHFFLFEERRAFIFVIIGLIVGVGSLSGFFPAFILSSFDPVIVLKIGGLNSRRFSKKNTVSVQIRRLLVISQFIIATALIIVTLVIYEQIRFLKTVDMGFDKEQMLVLNLPAKKKPDIAKIDSLIALLEKQPVVKAVEKTPDLPGYKNGRLLFFIEDGDSSQHLPLNCHFVAHNYLQILDLELSQGRFFHPDSARDDTTAFVINEAALNIFGNEPIGRKVKCSQGVDGRIIGVLKDFHYESLKGEIEPMVFMLSTRSRFRLLLKIDNVKEGKAVEEISQVWKQLYPGYLMHYSFLDDNFNEHYEEEDKLFTLFLFVACMAIFIALLGLLGLSTFIIEQQTKTIGIKKTLGASVAQLVYSLIKEFSTWVLIASFLAWPIAFLLSKGWLGTFAYRVDLNILWFVGASSLIIVFAIITVSFQAFNAASRPPYEALKYE